jgi:integrase
MTTKTTPRVAKLTKTSVDEAKPEASRYILWDEKLKGFGLKVEPSGTKTFIVRYRVGGGRSGTLREFKIGRFGKITPDEARAEAKKSLGRVEVGEDPQNQRAAARKVLTIAELCDVYLDEGMSTKKPTTQYLDRIRINGFVRSHLGRRKITEVGREDVERLRDLIATGQAKGEPLTDDEKGALKRKDPNATGLPSGRRVRGGKTAATRTIKLLNSMFKFAIGRKLCKENPCKGVALFADVERERFLSTAEVASLGDALTAATEEGKHPYLAAIVRLLMFSGARKNEIARLRWSEVDLDRAVIQLEESKTGRKPIQLGAAALQVLNGIERTKSLYVFPEPADPAKPIHGIDWYWVGIRNRAKLPGVRLHDLRHSFASAALGGGASLAVIQRLLGHKRIQTTMRYAHLADDPVKSAADAISNHLSAAMERREADITPMRRAR